MKKYFLDTEFVERPGLLDLISIALVCEDGREFYAVSSEFDVFPKLPPRETWLPRAEIARRLRAFITGKPTFCGYYADYWLRRKLLPGDAALLHALAQVEAEHRPAVWQINHGAE